MSQLEVVTTDGGARAIVDRVTGEVMHPVVGPLVESSILYVAQSRLVARLADGAGEPARELVLFDVGLGAASNAIAAWSVSEARASSDGDGRRLTIISFEQDLDPLRLALEHPDDFGLAGAAGEAARALLASGAHETARTRWRLVQGQLPGTLAASGALADIVYWDPYSPTANPQLWTVAAFATLRAACAERATLYTYSGATAVRTALLLAGFAVGAGDPIGRKASTTAAAVDRRDLARPLDGRFLERLTRSSAPYPADAPIDALARIAAAPQFAR